MVRLRGEQFEYIFDPEDKKSVLQREGKFGQVFLGKRAEDGLSVVIKKLHHARAADPIARYAFRREALFVFDHPNIVRQLDYIEQEGDHYLVREFVAGIDLKHYEKRGWFSRRPDWRFYVKLGIQALQGLSALHKEGVFHRDIKPSNLLLAFIPGTKEVDLHDPHLKLMDLGMAMTAQELQKLEDLSYLPFSMVYASPEQLLNYHSLYNASSDLYSLAITLYEAITGRPAFRSHHPSEMMTLQLVYHIEPHRRLPDKLFRILQKATSKYRLPKPPQHYYGDELRELLKEGQKERFQTAEEMKNELEQLL